MANFCRGYGYNCRGCMRKECLDYRGKPEIGYNNLISKVEIRLYDYSTNKLTYKMLSEFELKAIINLLDIK